MKLQQLLLIIAVSAISAVGSVAVYNTITINHASLIGSSAKGIPANYARFFDGKNISPSDAPDLTKAAGTAVPAVVHIKTIIPAKKVSNNLPRRRSIFDDFFGEAFGNMGPNIIPEQRASGSGVILSDDGYIVTNNHVITDETTGNPAPEINVTLHNRKTYKARLIGRDPSSDIAVLKIDGKDLPYLVYGNSDQLQLGQWVLAIGYPLTLETTVTAGIVSASGRTININSRQTRRGETPIESFIQTDAAVNQGNSGGALVNTSGELVGINSAILAPTGTYAGYSFAIPVNIIKKIVGDIVQYGDVKRGYLGIRYYTTEGMTNEQIKSLGIPTNVDGVFLKSVSPDGGAATAGIQQGDVIVKVNGKRVTNGMQLGAEIASFRPGDKVPITYTRDGKEYTVEVTLKEIAQVVENVIDRLGADLATLDETTARKNGINGGVVVKKINSGGILANSRIQAGFIITGVITRQGPVTITSVEELNEVLSNIIGRVQVQGIYPGYSEPYTYPLNMGQ